MIENNCDVTIIPLTFQGKSEFSPRLCQKSSYDTIRYGKEGVGFFSRVFHQVGSFFSMSYNLFVSFFLKIFSLCGCKDKEGVDDQQYRIWLEKLQACRESFSLRSKRDDFAAFKSWWKEQFESLPMELREMMLFEDVKSWGGDQPDPEAWAKEQFADRSHTARAFVVELKKVENYDPIAFVPKYFDRVIEKIQAKIQESDKSKTK